jgi:thymidylate synthase
VLRLEDGAIVASHYAPSGVLLQEFRAATAAELSVTIRPFISQIDHALHIGGELAKAEAALRLPSIAFAQDQPLRDESGQAS